MLCSSSPGCASIVVITEKHTPDIKLLECMSLSVMLNKLVLDSCSDNSERELLIMLIFLPFVDGCVFAPSLAAEFSNGHHQLFVLMRVYRRDRENMKLLCPGYSSAKVLRNFSAWI